MGRELWVQVQRVAHQVEPGEAEHDGLPQTPQSGDPNAAGAVRVQLKVRGGGLA